MMHTCTYSTITLTWIQSSLYDWITFIANRTKQIQSLTPPLLWWYVSITDNPVDCALCGLYPSKLLEYHIWLTRLALLSKEMNTWPPISNYNELDIKNDEAHKPLI